MWIKKKFNVQKTTIFTQIYSNSRPKTKLASVFWFSYSQVPVWWRRLLLNNSTNSSGICHQTCQWLEERYVSSLSWSIIVLENYPNGSPCSIFSTNHQGNRWLTVVHPERTGYGCVSILTWSVIIALENYKMVLCGQYSPPIIKGIKCKLREFTLRELHNVMVCHRIQAEETFLVVLYVWCYCMQELWKA